MIHVLTCERETCIFRAAVKIRAFTVGTAQSKLCAMDLMSRPDIQRRRVWRTRALKSTFILSMLAKYYKYYKPLTQY
jgi:hypothetical protein